ncbi:MAG: hypothetical protein WA667_07320 [Candidatus Nitrosopolaris sp.]
MNRNNKTLLTIVVATSIAMMFIMSSTTSGEVVCSKCGLVISDKIQESVTAGELFEK